MLFQDVLEVYNAEGRKGQTQLISEMIVEDGEGGYAVDLDSHHYKEKYKRMVVNKKAKQEQGITFEEACVRAGGAAG